MPRGGYRGSVNRGEGNPAAKLTSTDVVRIREEYASGIYTAQRLAKKYGMGASSIKRLLKGESFADAGGPTFKLLPNFQEIAWGYKPETRASGEERDDA